MRINWLVWMMTVCAVACSCVSPTQELSAYWEEHDFSSLEEFDDIDAAEERFDGYVALLSRVDADDAVKNMIEFMDSAARNEVAYMVWASWFEPYLHALESPYRSDALFAAWLDKVMEDKVLDEYTLERLRKTRDVMRLNVAGQPAADVILKDADGQEFRISNLKGQKTLLMLLDADCPSCMDHLNDILKERELKEVRLVAVLVNGSPMHVRNISSRLPEEVLSRWTLAWCPGREVERGEVYDLTMVPSRMMLDSENIVEKSYYK